MDYNNNTSFFPSEQEVKKRLYDLESKIKEEQDKDNPNGKLITKLYNQQLMQGLWLQTFLN